MKTRRHENKGLRKLCEHPRRAWAKCACPWHFNFKWKGTHYRFSLDKHLDRHVDSKSVAEDEAAILRIAIKAGKFGQPAAREDMTLRQLADAYLEGYVAVERAASQREYTYLLGRICSTEVQRPTAGQAPLGDWRLTDIVTDSIERFRKARREAGTGVVGTNRYLSRLRALFNWGVRTGYIEQSPFKRGTEAVVRLSKEHGRSRRLDGDEEAKLLAACGPHLRACVEAAIETGMRLGEILSLQWHQIEGLRIETAEDGTATFAWAPKAEIVLPWTKTKTRRDRRIPISTRLRGILEMRRLDPSGAPLAGTDYVFGTTIGTRVLSFKRAWATAVLKAHGHAPSYTETASLAAESRAALAAIDLHFHDLRREAGSRWLDGGVPLHTVRDWLGHTNISQTSTYLSGTAATQHDAMLRFEAHQAALQQIATKAGTGGQARAQTASGRKGKPRKSAVGRSPAIM